jgi:hypothetical protein
MSIDSSPIRMLAIQRLRDDFGDLLEVKSEITDFERELFVCVFEYMWLHDPGDYSAWERRVRACYYFLNKAFEEKNPRGVSAIVQTAADRLSFALGDQYNARKEHRQSKDGDGHHGRSALALYKTLVEGPYRILLAPLAYSFAQVMGLGDPAYKPDVTGKVPLCQFPPNTDPLFSSKSDPPNWSN